MVYSYNGIKRNRLLIDQQEYSKMLKEALHTQEKPKMHAGSSYSS